MKHRRREASRLYNNPIKKPPKQKALLNLKIGEIIIIIGEITLLL